MKRRNGVMTDYEYLFSTNLHAKLKEKIGGGIFVKVNEKDSLIVKIERKDGNNFDISFTDFSNRLIYGFSNEIKGSAETSGLLFLYY
jgi:hypothetical protein